MGIIFPQIKSMLVQLQFFWFFQIRLFLEHLSLFHYRPSIFLSLRGPSFY
uniref:Uncharacterized protein n=1 Tax=Arundo donax TaxID=35708 RepID=A0A0A8YUN4_ARUDO